MNGNGLKSRDSVISVIICETLVYNVVLVYHYYMILGVVYWRYTVIHVIYACCHLCRIVICEMM